MFYAHPQHIKQVPLGAYGAEEVEVEVDNAIDKGKRCHVRGIKDFFRPFSYH